MNEMIVSNEENFEKVKKLISKEGANKFHVISDFDGTLIKRFVDGEKVQSLLSILRSSGDYLSSEYETRAKGLFKKYRPIESDKKLSVYERKRAMHEWWTKHFELLIDFGLNKSDLHKVIKSNKLRLRKGIVEFLDYLNNKKIPLVIMSSSGLGDAISMLLEREQIFHNNIYIITNTFKWDNKGNAIAAKKPIIHSMNKDETSIKNYPAFNLIKNRKNVLLLGDKIEDIGMVKGYDCDNLIKIGFLNDEVKKNLKLYKMNFDVVLLNDTNMNYVNQILHDLFE